MISDWTWADLIYKYCFPPSQQASTSQGRVLIVESSYYSVQCSAVPSHCPGLVVTTGDWRNSCPEIRVLSLLILSARDGTDREGGSSSGSLGRGNPLFSLSSSYIQYNSLPVSCMYLPESSNQSPAGSKCYKANIDNDHLDLQTWELNSWYVTLHYLLFTHVNINDNWTNCEIFLTRYRKQFSNLEQEARTEWNMFISSV